MVQNRQDVIRLGYQWSLSWIIESSGHDGKHYPNSQGHVKAIMKTEDVQKLRVALEAASAIQCRIRRLEFELEDQQTRARMVSKEVERLVARKTKTES